MLVIIFHRHAGVFQILSFSPLSRAKSDTSECIRPPGSETNKNTKEDFHFRAFEGERTRGKSMRLKFFYILRGLSSSLRNAKGGRIFFNTGWEKKRSGVVCSHWLICTHAILKRGIHFILVISCGLSFWVGKSKLNPSI